MPPINLRELCDATTERLNTTESMSDDEEFNALLYIVFTLLFYSLGISIGIITYLKGERREMEEDKAYEDFLTWQTDPFTTIKAQRVQQIAARLRELEEQKKQRELELFQRELEIGAGKAPLVKPPAENTKKSHSLKIPRFTWSRSSGRRRDDDSGGRRASSEDFSGIPLQAVAGFTGIACQFVTPHYVLSQPLFDRHSMEMKYVPKHKLIDPTERRNCLQKTPRLISRQERLHSGETSPNDILATTVLLPYIDASPVESNTYQSPTHSNET